MSRAPVTRLLFRGSETSQPLPAPLFYMTDLNLKKKKNMYQTCNKQFLTSYLHVVSTVQRLRLFLYKKGNIDKRERLSETHSRIKALPKAVCFFFLSKATPLIKQGKFHAGRRDILTADLHVE